MPETITAAAAAGSKLRPGLDPLPRRMASLPVHRGYPTPWFVAYVNGEPEFRAMDGLKWTAAVNKSLCWVCGQVLGQFRSFVIGPMCGINRVTSEPPCHFKCAQWSARNCPFLTQPGMERRTGGMGGPLIPPAGLHLDHNPGLTLVWVTKSYKPFRADGPVGRPGWLIRIGEPTEIEFWRERRPATRAEIADTVERGWPKLAAAAAMQGQEVTDELLRARRKFEALVAAHV